MKLLVKRGSLLITISHLLHMNTTLLVKMLKLLQNVVVASKQCRRENIQIESYHHLNQNLSYLISAHPTCTKYASVLSLLKKTVNTIKSNTDCVNCDQCKSWDHQDYLDSLVNDDESFICTNCLA